MIKKYWQKFISSEFNRNSLILISGTTIAQLLPIAIYPILTRIYTPEDFGVLALFSSLSIIFSLAITGRYELALILPKKDGHAFSLLNFIFVISAFFSLLLMIIILLFHNFFLSLLNEEKISVWLYFLPPTIFFLGSYTALNFYHTRLKNYKILAKYRIARSATMATLQTGLFFLHNGTIALILGYIVAQIVGFAGLLKQLTKQFKEFKFNRLKMIIMAKKYKNFPALTLPSSFFNKLSTEMPNVLIAPVFNSTFLGFYSLGYRILTVPSTFIGTSVSQVFMQAATDQLNKTGKAKQIFLSTLKKLLAIGIPFFGILFLIAEPVFGFIFGKEWIISGTYAKILMPLLFMRFIASPLSSVLYIFEKHKILFFAQITMFLLSVAVFSIAYFSLMKFINFLILYSIVISVFYVIYLVISYLVAIAKI